MTWVDTSIVVFIITFIVLLVWCRVQDQSMYDTIMEIKDIVRDLFK